MIEIHTQTADNGLQLINIRGHAEYNPGNDIVCAGVSALIGAAAAVLEKNDEVDVLSCRLSEGVGHLVFRGRTEKGLLQAQTVMDYFKAGADGINCQYPVNTKTV